MRAGPDMQKEEDKPKLTRVISGSAPLWPCSTFLHASPIGIPIHHPVVCYSSTTSSISQPEPALVTILYFFCLGLQDVVFIFMKLINMRAMV